MAKPSLTAAVALLAVTMAVTGIVASPNEPPLADAGLDQDVSKGATVLLDGTGSHDPDGSIESYRWTVRTPDGGEVALDCRTCARTSFAPDELGRYRVTLTVTDEDGATSSDTLYVDVAPGTEPGISLGGPTEPTEGDVETYTADLDRGTAELDHVVWSVDGTEIANHSLSPDQRTDTAEKRFPTAGSRTLTATVYDADGQNATSALDVAVRSDPTTESDVSPGIDPDPERSLANRTSPTVTGDAVVTGTEPLRGHYDVRLDAAADKIETVEWWNSAGRIGDGRSLTRVWEPGDHDIYAVVSYTDGTENIATFDDGSTDVVADPKPNVSIDSLDRFGEISGTVTGLDGYGNLEITRVEVDGETVATSGSNLRDDRRYDVGRRQTVSFSHADFTPGERHLVSVTATDQRGQTARTTAELVPVKQPEIVRSEFVNDPVDSYHPRINSSRYTAHHVLEIDLNGVDPENLDIIYDNGPYTQTADDHSYNEEHETLIYNSFWKGDQPGEYVLDVEITLDAQPDYWIEDTSRFEVTPSKPELRLDVLNDGTKGYITKNHGIRVDASDSFDPDGTDLKYIWKYGATPEKSDNSTAKFRAYERAASVVEDGYDLQAERNFDFLDHFVPGVESRQIQTDGPYYSDTTVRVRIETEAYHLSKQTYYDDFELGISADDSDVEVLEWHQIPAPDSEHSGPAEDAYRYAGTVEVPASKLSSTTQNPEITVFNANNERKRISVDLPDASVWVDDGSYWLNPTVRDLTYTIEKPEIREVTADSKSERDAYRVDGYSVDAKDETTEYVLEERVKVQDAEYETETREFTSRDIREMFLSAESEWYPSGSYQKEVARTRTEKNWHDTRPSSRPEWGDSNLWNGEFTGDTRRKLVEPAEYVTENQYEYEYEVEKTGTRSVTRTATMSVPRTGTRTTTECRYGIGCYEVTEEYTYYETVTYTYTTTRTYTYTVTRSDTYWASSKLGSDHQRTGESRLVKVHDAVYKTQYEVKQKERYTETVPVYEAAREVQVAPPKYDWNHVQTTEEGMLARRKANMDDDWRLSETNTDTEWTLSKQTGTMRFELDDYENDEHVVETSATVEGEVHRRYVHEETGDVTSEVEEKIEEYTSSGAKTRQEIVAELNRSDEDPDWCEMKPDC